MLEHLDVPPLLTNVTLVGVLLVILRKGKHSNSMRDDLFFFKDSTARKVKSKEKQKEEVGVR